MPDRSPESAPRTEQGAVSILLLLPNMITLIGMCLGLTAIRFAIEDRFAAAVLLILLAALADLLDGLVARRFGAESPMGAQLDSLSDFLSFGVAPAILVYQVHLTQSVAVGWMFCLLFAAASCLRLARFNVLAGQSGDNTGPKTHFVGVPAPSGAVLGLLPVFLTLAGVLAPGSAPVAVSAWLALVGILMISKVKTPTLRAINVPRRLIAVILCATAIVTGLIFTHPWFFLVAVDATYLVIVGFAILRARGSLFG